jgi:hypothetical protein
VFIELPAFKRLRNEYLDDESFRAMQNAMPDDPSAGDRHSRDSWSPKPSLDGQAARQGEARRPASYVFLLGPWIVILAIHSVRQE